MVSEFKGRGGGGKKELEVGWVRREEEKGKLGGWARKEERGGCGP